MSDVTLIGLGAMGSALAKALIDAGHSITVWNRSPERLDNIVALGAQGASDVFEAVKASNLVLVCVSNYTATRNFLETEDVLPHLDGKTLVQMGTGTPGEARDNEAWMKSHGGDYLDVTIDPYPEGIGEEDSMFFISGSKAAYELSKPFLKNFGGDLRYLGENVGAANTLDLSELIYSLCRFVGFAHAARLCEIEGVGLDQFASIYHEGEPARKLAEMVHANNYALGAIHPGASVRVWEGCVQLIQDHARTSGINDEVPKFVSRLFKKAIALGYGEEDVAALVKALR
jgi:3-hydroxyisobutyrate dehydrogenase-like beta-hydroxyacid dehydrogenase